MQLTNEHITAIWNGMPGGFDGFCKTWGYQQFARAVIDAVICKAEKRDVFFGDGKQIWVTATFPVTSFEAAIAELKPRVDEYVSNLEYLNDGSDCD